jgi:hypothetical protein
MTKRSINPRTEEGTRALGPDHQRLEHRRELERVRKRVARKRQTPEEREQERARKRKHAYSKRPSSANVKKNGKEGATARR